jgi:hypothetical protein
MDSTSPLTTTRRKCSACRRRDDDTETNDRGLHVNIRSLTRGDGAVIVAAVLLLIASFLPFFTYPGNSVNAWDSALFPLLPTVHLAALITALLFVAARFQPEGRKVLGLGFDQWGVALSVFVAWSALWSIFASILPSGGDNSMISLGAGAWLTLLFAFALAVVAVLSRTHPAFAGPLLPEPRPQQPQSPYGYPGPQPGGYGYPGSSEAPPSFGAGQPHPYGPPASQPQPQPQPQVIQLASQPASPHFAAFWFAVPVTRLLLPEDGSAEPIAELTPGIWYLAVDQRGPALVAQTQDGRRGVLQDTSGIQRG